MMRCIMHTCIALKKKDPPSPTNPVEVVVLHMAANELCTGNVGGSCPKGDFCRNPFSCTVQGFPKKCFEQKNNL